MAVTVHVVAGFLGAGKTSVLRTLLGHVASDCVGVVVNDFGEAAIDQQALSDLRSSVREIRGSCVCCTAPEGFVAEVGQLLDDGALDRIFVEPTGIARPADVIDTLRRAPHADLELGPLIVVVDAHRLGSDDLPAEVVAQATAADVLVLNRTDVATPGELERARAWVATLWPGPHAVCETSFGAVDASVLAWPEGAPDRRASPVPPSHDHDHDHDHDHPYAVRTLSWPPDTVFHRDRLLQALGAEELERAKGVFRADEGTVLLQVAGGTLTEAPSPRRSDSRVDLIVAHEHEPRLAAIADSLQRAVMTAEEQVARADQLEVAMPDGRTRVFDRAGLIALPNGVADVSSVVPGRQGAAAQVWQALQSAGATEGDRAVVVASDGFVTEPVPLHVLRQAVLVHTLDEAPLPPDRGGPFRLLLPPDAADGVGGPCANVKSVVRIAIRNAS